MHRVEQDQGKCQAKGGIVSLEAVPLFVSRVEGESGAGGSSRQQAGGDPGGTMPGRTRGGERPEAERSCYRIKDLGEDAVRGAYYPEANSTNRQNECTRWVVGRCAEGHTHVKSIFCGREWCPTCGQEGSDLHKRRQSKWLPKVAEASAWRYLVITLPEEVRGRYRTKAALAAFRTKIMRKLKRMGCSRGLSRYHFFGEGKDGVIPVYHPHLNILTPGAWIPRDQVKELKRFVAKVLEVELDRINLRVSYAKTWPKLLHRVRYITRSTFLDASWDEEMSRELVGFRNGHSWGKWTGESVWPVELVKEDLAKGYAVLMYERGLCPDCGTGIIWEEILRELDPRTWRDRGGGYWSLRKYEFMAKTA